MRRTSILDQSQQLIFCALALIEEHDLVAMLRALRDHPDRNTTIDLLNQALDQGLAVMDLTDDHGPMRPLMMEGGLVLQVILLRNRMVWLTIGSSGPQGEASDWRFTFDDLDQVVKVEFEGSHNIWLLGHYFNPVNHTN